MTANTVSKMRIALISAGVLSVAVAIQFTAPSVIYFCLHRLPSPYLYLLINCIILTIAVSSRFHNHHNFNDIPQPHSKTSFQKLLVQIHKIDDTKEEIVKSISPEETGEEEIVESSSPAETGEEEIVKSGSPAEGKEETVKSASPAEKPLVSTRFALRKAVKTSNEVARALSVSKPTGEETLESTWKTITDGRVIQLARYKKHESPFSPSPPSTANLRKEPSMGLDDLNKRVEAFIKKINDEMRIQRQKSLDLYNKMINHCPQKL